MTTHKAGYDNTQEYYREKALKNEVAFGYLRIEPGMTLWENMPKWYQTAYYEAKNQ